MTPQLFLQMFFNALTLSAEYILVALGLTIIFGIMHIVNFAHGELYMLGGFGIYVFNMRLGLNYFLAMAIAVVIVTIIGIFMERYFFRRFGRDILPVFIVGLGFVLIFQNAVMLIFGPNFRQRGAVFAGSLNILGARTTVERAVVVAFAAVLVLSVILFIQRTKIGRSMRAVEQDAEAASLMGISIGGIRSLCMGIGCAVAAVAGGLMFPVFGADPWVGAPLVMRSFMVIILGGMGSVPGAILGGLLVGFVEAYLSFLWNPMWALLVAFSLVILILVVRPRGLLGHA